MLLTYDGFALPYSHLTQFNQESLYDDSGTDKIATKFDVRVQCVINLNHLQLIEPGDGTLGVFPAGANAATLISALREKLLRPRRSLSIKVNGQEMIPNPTGGPGTVDAMNGPQPRACNIVQVTAETCLVDYQIQAHYVENLTQPADRLGNRQVQLLLVNRWTEAVTIDDLGASVRVRSGRFVLRSDNRLGKIPDELRDQFAVLSVPAGFLRQSGRYTAEPDGLALSYEITDKEVFKYPPPGAYRAEGRYREIGKGLSTPVRYGEVDVTLYGPPSNNVSDQASLLYKAMQIAAFKLDCALGNSAKRPALPLPLPNNRTATPVEVTAEVDMYNNKVHYRLVARFNGARAESRTSVAGLRNTMCQTPYSEGDGVQPVYFNRGTANLLVQAASYFDPSAANQTLTPEATDGGAPQVATADDQRIQNNAGLRPGEAGKTRED